MHVFLEFRFIFTKISSLSEKLPPRQPLFSSTALRKMGDKKLLLSKYNITVSFYQLQIFFKNLIDWRASIVAD